MYTGTLILEFVARHPSRCSPAGPVEKQSAAQPVRQPDVRSTRDAWGTHGIAGAAGRAWSYVTNEAALADVEAPAPSLPRPSLNITVTLKMESEPCCSEAMPQTAKHNACRKLEKPYACVEHCLSSIYMPHTLQSHVKMESQPCSLMA